MASGKYSAAADFLANFATRQQQLRKKQSTQHIQQEEITVKPAPPPGIPPKHAVQIQNKYKTASDPSISIESLSAPCLEERHTALLHQLKKMKAMIAFGEKERQQLLLERMKLLTEYQMLEQKYRQSIAYINRINHKSEVAAETVSAVVQENEDNIERSTSEKFSEREEYLIKTVANLQHALKACVERLKSNCCGDEANYTKANDDKLNRRKERQMNSRSDQLNRSTNHSKQRQQKADQVKADQVKADQAKANQVKANQSSLKQQQTNHIQILAERDALFHYARRIECELVQEKNSRIISRFLYNLEKGRLLRMQKALSHWKLLFRFHVERIIDAKPSVQVTIVGNEETFYQE